jgi:hypothetical protein
MRTNAGGTLEEGSRILIWPLWRRRRRNIPQSVMSAPSAGCSIKQSAPTLSLSPAAQFVSDNNAA